MKIFVTPTFAELQGRIPAQTFNRLSDTLRYRSDGYQHTRAFKAHHWDGYVSLMKQQKYSVFFPAGLLHHVTSILEEDGLECERQFVDLPRLEPSRPITKRAMLRGAELYDDQVEAVECAVEHQRGLLSLATNFGKTLFAAAVFVAFPKVPALYLVAAKTNLHQTVRRFDEYGVPANRPGSAVTVAMIQTLHRRRRKPETRKLLERSRILIVDEGDIITPKLWYPTLGACRAPFRIAMSGTIEDAPSLLPVEAFFGPVLMSVKEATLIAQGRSAKPTIIMPWVGSMASDGSDYGSTHPSSEAYEGGVYLEGVVRNDQRNVVFVEAAKWGAARGLRSLVLFYLIEHGERLHAMFRAAGLRSALIHGKTPDHDVAQANRDLTERRLDAVIGSTIYNRSVDLPAAEVVGNAAAWESRRATRQKLGRALRRKLEGENRVLVVDPYDLGARLLKDHAGGRERQYGRLGCEVIKGNVTELLQYVQQDWAMR